MSFLSNLFSAFGSKKVVDAPSPAGSKSSQLPTVVFIPVANAPPSRAIASQELDYNLAVLDPVVDTESIVFQTISKIVERMFNSGCNFVSSDPKALEYIRRRFYEFSIVTNIPTNVLLEQAAWDTILYSNGYLVKVRDQDSSSGKPWNDNDDEDREPIAALIRTDPSAVVPHKNKRGLIDYYELKETITIAGGGGNQKAQRIKPKDILHIYAYKRGRYAQGTPSLWPVLQDIRTLRHIEENVDLLVHKHIFPLYQYIVGLDDAPARPEEIEYIKQKIQEMPPQGAFVTPERHKVVVIGAEGEALDVSKYLEHFMRRVLMGTGLGEVSFGVGNGANRATAEVIDRALIERAKYFQKLLCIFFNEQLIPELLAEGGYDIYNFGKTPDVELKFAEVDFDAKIKKENHYINLFNNNGITENEMREGLGRDVIPPTGPERELLKWALYNVPAMEMEQKLKEAAANTTKNADQPKNQHGEQGSPKRNSSLEVNDSYQPSQLDEQTIAAFKAAQTDTINIIKQALAQARSLNPQDLLGIQTVIGVAESQIKTDSTPYIEQAFYQGLRQGGVRDHVQHIEDIVKTEIIPVHDRLVQKTMTNIRKDVINLLERHSTLTQDTPVSATALFDVKKHYITETNSVGLSKARHYGAILAARLSGKDKVAVVANKDCKICKDHHGQILDTRLIDSDTLPGYHGNCSCTLGPAPENIK
jgi:hypothetical protein